MPIHFRLFLGVLGLLFFVSCSSPHSSTDADILPDEDVDTQDFETQDDDSDIQEAEFVEDSDELPDFDSDLEESVPDDDEYEEFDDTDRINDYKRCYCNTRPNTTHAIEHSV